MGRPSVKPEVRAAALASAARRTARHGFERSSLQDLADDVGVTKQALLYYFRTKDALKAALVAELLEDADARFREIVEALSEGERDRPALTTVLDHLERYLEEAPDAAPAMLRFVLDRDEDAMAQIRERIVPWVDFVGAQIQEGRELGLVRPELTAEAVFTHVGLLVVAHFSALPLGDLQPGRPKRGWRRQRLQQLLQTIGWVVFSDDKRPAVFSAQGKR